MLRFGRVYRNYRNTQTKLISTVLDISASTILIAFSMGSALPLTLTNVVHANGVVDISSVADLRNAIENQADGQTWTIEPGTYGLAPFNDITAGCPSSCQTGWYFPITANNITIKGIGNPTIYGNSYTANGDWSTQDLMAIFGNKVTVNGLTLMPKVEPNKTIEVVGNNTTIENTTIEPNTLVDPSEYTNLSDQTEAQWGGSIYYNGAAGTQRLQKVTIDNGGVSYHAAAAGVHLSFSNVTLNYATNADWINGYRYSNHFDNPTGSKLTGTPKVVYHVSSTLNNLNDVLSNLQDNDTISIDSNLTTSQQITLTKSVTLNGNGHTISPSFTKTDNSNNSALGIQANTVTVNNLVENGKNGTDLHGINVFGSNNVNINNVTVENNNHSGLNVDGSAVTVKNLTTAHDGWDGVDVDKLGAVLTVNGTSHHNETTPDIYVDSSSVGQVVDTNSQYYFVSNVSQPGDRAYYLKPTVPTNGKPNGGFETTNNFYFTWNGSKGPAPLTYEYQTSLNPASKNGVLTTGIWNNIKNGNSVQKNLTSPKILSVGAPDGTWYWQVRAIDARGGASNWSPIWSAAIDTHAPTGLTNVSPDNGTYTTTTKLAQISWSAATDANGPVTYFYESSNSSTTNPTDGAFTNPAYVSGPLNTNSIDTLGTPAGTYYWHVKAVDAAGNSTPWTSAWKVTVDNTRPTVKIVSPTDFSKLFSEGPTVTVSATDPDSGLQTIVTHIYDSTNKLQPICGSATSAELAAGEMSCDLSSLPNGTYYIKAGAFDKAGNNSTVTSDSFTISKSPLVVVNNDVTIHPSNPFTNNGNITSNNVQPTSPTPLQGSNNNVAVVGGGNYTSNNDENGHVKGASITMPNTATMNTIKAANVKNVASKFFGVAWYCWALVVLIVFALIFTVYRRANIDDFKQ